MIKIITYSQPAFKEGKYLNDINKKTQEMIGLAPGYIHYALSHL